MLSTRALFELGQIFTREKGPAMELGSEVEAAVRSDERIAVGDEEETTSLQVDTNGFYAPEYSDAFTFCGTTVSIGVTEPMARVRDDTFVVIENVHENCVCSYGR